MYNKHITQELPAYCHGELEAEESRAIAEHLMGCQKCRQDYEEIKLGIKLTAQLEPVYAPATMWNEIEAALDNPPKRLRGFSDLLRFTAYPQWLRIVAVAPPLGL